MANVDAPHGFGSLARTRSGGPPEISTYEKDASEATAIFVGDLCELEADANIAPGGTPGTTRYIGVALNFGAATTLTEHQVVTSPDALYEVQDDDPTTGVVAADVGLLANAIFGAGSNERSGHELDQSTLAVTATLDLKVLGLYKTPGNAFGGNARVIVEINKHRNNKEVAGV